MKKMLIVLLGATQFATAASKICVKNYVGAGGTNPCEVPDKKYVYVAPWPGVEELVCARVYEGFYCDQNEPAFSRVLTEDKAGSICTVNFEQPGISNFCVDNPKSYLYAIAAD